MLTTCPDCQQQVSTNAASCPKCGCVINRARSAPEFNAVKNWVIDKMLMLLIAGAIGTVVVIIMAKSYSR